MKVLLCRMIQILSRRSKAQLFNKPSPSRLYFLLCILIGLCISIKGYSQAPVDGFFKGNGTKTIGLGLGYEASDIYFAGCTEIDLTRNSTTASLFGIVGLHDDLDLSLSIPFVSVNSEAGLQDVSLYLKYRVHAFEFSASKLELNAAAGISTPMTDYNTEIGSSIGQQATVIDLRPMLHYQMNKGWFATAQYSYMIKSDPTPTASGFAFKLGKATANNYFDIWYTSQFADGGLDYRGAEEVTTFKELGTEFHKAGATYYRPLSDKTGAYLGAHSIFDGRNVSKGIGASLGVVIDL